jgi:uncharacterized protein YdeI (YjbR/CyaY-like superfamily)
MPRKNEPAPDYAALLAAHVKSGDKVRLRKFLKTELPDALRSKLCAIADIDDTTLSRNTVVFELQKKLTNSSPRGHLLTEARIAALFGTLGTLLSVHEMWDMFHTQATEAPQQPQQPQQPSLQQSQQQSQQSQQQRYLQQSQQYNSAQKKLSHDKVVLAASLLASLVATAGAYTTYQKYTRHADRHHAYHTAIQSAASNARTSRASRTSKAMAVARNNGEVPDYAALLAAHVKSGNKVRLRKFLKTELPDALRRKMCTIADIDETLPLSTVVFELQKKLTDSTPRGHLLAEAGLMLVGAVASAAKLLSQMILYQGSAQYPAVGLIGTVGMAARARTAYRKYTRHKGRHNAYLAAAIQSASTKAPSYAERLTAHVKSGDKVRLRKFLKEELPDPLRHKLCVIADVDDTTLPLDKVVFELQKKLADTDSAMGNLLVETSLAGLFSLATVGTAAKTVLTTDGVKPFDKVAAAGGIVSTAFTVNRAYNSYQKYTKHKDRHDAYLAALK